MSQGSELAAGEAAVAPRGSPAMSATAAHNAIEQFRARLIHDRTVIFDLFLARVAERRGCPAGQKTDGALLQES
jgi:hypothetical protein